LFDDAFGRGQNHVTCRRKRLLRLPSKQ
jgi:hypothetical protein